MVGGVSIDERRLRELARILQPTLAKRIDTALLYRAGVLGLIVDRPARTLGIESFFMQLISGIEATLSAGSVGPQESGM